MTVTFYLHTVCPTCGYRNRGVQVSPVRVNKATLRTQGVSLGFNRSECWECDAPLPNDYPRQIRLAPGDAVKVAAYRAKRWPA